MACRSVALRPARSANVLMPLAFSRPATLGPIPSISVRSSPGEELSPLVIAKATSAAAKTGTAPAPVVAAATPGAVGAGEALSISAAAAAAAAPGATTPAAGVAGEAGGGTTAARAGFMLGGVTGGVTAVALVASRERWRHQAKMRTRSRTMATIATILGQVTMTAMIRANATRSHNHAAMGHHLTRGLGERPDKNSR